MNKRAEPRYYKYHRVYSMKKHCNGTVLRNYWSDKANDWVYEIITDKGEKVYSTHWNIMSEKPIPRYIGESAHDLETEQNCKIVDIIGFNSSNMQWIFQIRLDNGEIVTRTESRLTHFYQLRKQQ
jgi:hypothetical protein